jgi:hypothetical protein
MMTGSFPFGNTLGPSRPLCTSAAKIGVSQVRALQVHAYQRCATKRYTVQIGSLAPIPRHPIRLQPRAQDPDPAQHRRRFVPSSPPLANVLPSGERATELTECLPVLTSSMSLPVRASQSFTVPP